MTREEAVERLKSIKSLVDKYDDVVALREAIKALEQEPCEDAISRQAVDEAIYDYSRSCDVNYAQIMEYIDKIPSVNPKPKTGHWIWENVDRYWICSECERINEDDRSAYCKYCGAKMESEEQT